MSKLLASDTLLDDSDNSSVAKLESEANISKVELTIAHSSFDAIARMFDVFLGDYSEAELRRLVTQIKDRLVEDRIAREEKEARIEELVSQ